MKDSNEIKLSLVENSHSFLYEAVSYAISAEESTKKWQFAIINLVQALELSLKALLYNIHSILIFDNIDSPKNTVSITQAMKRLQNPAIGNISFSKDEITKLHKAVDLRNQMIHSEFLLNSTYARVKFFEVFGFVIYFQVRYLKNEIEDIISTNSLNQLIAIEKNIKALSENAKRRIVDEGIDSEIIFECPNCENDTFVIQDNINTCYTCRHTEDIIECKRCGNYFFEWQMKNISNLFETEYCEGETIVHNNYGYNYSQACFECINEIRAEITQQQLDDAYYWEMMNYYSEKQPE